MSEFITDYSKLKLRASSSPHIRSQDSSRSLMLDVLVALLPAFGMSLYVFGLDALIRAVVSTAAAVGFEFLYRKLLKKPQSITDLSAAVTGLLLAFTCPPTIPVWMLIIGDFFAIFLVKQLYGGLGKNFLNPALAGRAALVACYAGAMTTWAAPNGGAILSAATPSADAVTTATPLALMKAGDFATLVENCSLQDMLLGTIGGSMGETSALLLLCGGIYLLLRKVITWHIPVAYIGTVALLTFLFPRGNDPLQFMLYNILGGGLMLGAFFMATDYVTSPVTGKGRLIYGIGCGLLTVFIRYYGSYPEGVCYSILVMNCCVWIIDKYVKPERFGLEEEVKKEAGAK